MRRKGIKVKDISNLLDAEHIIIKVKEDAARETEEEREGKEGMLLDVYGEYNVVQITQDEYGLTLTID